ncbi:MAG: hypothetical protein HGA81_04285 [Chlorobium limicola]|uniref:Type II secretion system protein GspG C-terminal domain-containing protein n=1 Tax=Chlorobium limicola (strain DSM 245 / NBRC 103803 / 6330) TaxID=290315 RepID=B3EC84_CHLL2|nr:hypothetical protein [Chlorobium limicola]ACD90159.1 hypothetical protein Clim_1090 [Chlorobium limicola DSM 245]NTV07810.1 hypothetical protein [Chlorobium limicola]NTV20017.1 hypothetical protein [Chlorobium limicola]
MNYARYRRLIALTVPLLVTAAIGYGLFLAGPPSEQRKLMLDRKRVDDLVHIEQAIDHYHSQRGKLPENLALLRHEQQPQLPVTDPETGHPYFYEPAGNDSYRLCAEFSRTSDTGNEIKWYHGSGRHCFTCRVKKTTPAQ